MQKRPLTTGEIAEYCHVTNRAVLKWIEEGSLRAYRTPGNHSRVSVEDFLEFLKVYNMPVPDEFQGIPTKKKILIVDDDKNMANSIKRTLNVKEKYLADIAYDGFDAGRKLFYFKPDLVILDMRMPGLNGYEVAKRIKDFPESTHVKIIAISAFFEEEGKEKILAVGANCCLDKPFNQEELFKKIEELIG
ncbi:MAG TPA: response regulator [Candidatus Omnitrophota bacterium]|nr:response regulator [Candidatus Omnitrophota bacterium]